MRPGGRGRPHHWMHKWEALSLAETHFPFPHPPQPSHTPFRTLTHTYTLVHTFSHTAALPPHPCRPGGRRLLGRRLHTLTHIHTHTHTCRPGGRRLFGRRLQLLQEGRPPAAGCCLLGALPRGRGAQAQAHHQRLVGRVGWRGVESSGGSSSSGSSCPRFFCHPTKSPPPPAPLPCGKGQFARGR
jgi:hypothetical protein